MFGSVDGITQYKQIPHYTKARYQYLLMPLVSVPIY